MAVEICRNSAGVGRDDAEVKVDDVEVREENFVFLWIYICGNCSELKATAVGSVQGMAKNIGVNKANVRLRFKIERLCCRQISRVCSF